MNTEEWLQENNNKLKPHGKKIISINTYRFLIISLFSLIIVIGFTALLFMINNDKFKSDINCGNVSLKCEPVNCPNIPSCPNINIPNCPVSVCEVQCPDINFPDEFKLVLKNQS